MFSSDSKDLVDCIFEAAKVVLNQPLMLEVFLPHDADKGQHLAHFLQKEDGIVVQPDDSVRLLVKSLNVHLFPNAIDAGHIYDHIYHVAAGELSVAT